MNQSRENIKVLFCRLFMLLWLLLSASICLAQDSDPVAPVLIAHAGGEIDQQTYTNSLEALNGSYAKGLRFFELDFSWTADGELVAIHDWNGTFQGQFLVPKERSVPTEAEFLELRTKTGLTQLGLGGVLAWAKHKGDAYIVTDVKHDNLKALNKIHVEYEAFQKQVIPQVYDYEEYNEVLKLGYDNIILTLYRISTTVDELLRFSKGNSPFAVTMPWQNAQAGLANLLNHNDIRVYAHTVNDIDLFISLKKKGVFGVYTDNLYSPGTVTAD